MTYPIPRNTASGAQPRVVTAIQRDDKGWPVYALQKALTTAGFTTGTDGAFGPQTLNSVQQFQAAARIATDGVAGPTTQRLLCERILALRDQEVPAGLLAGYADGEGGWLVAAVNSSKAGGIDCGLFQRRVYEPDYADAAVIGRAFDSDYQARLLVAQLLDRRAAFQPRAGTNDGYGGVDAREKAWRLAALNHNYPSGADTLSRTPVKSLSSYWTTPQAWTKVVQKKAADGSYYLDYLTFPDGVKVRTPLEWCHFYCGVLGGAHGTSGSVTRRVSAWT